MERARSGARSIPLPLGPPSRPPSLTSHPAALSRSSPQEASLCACMCVAWHSHRLHNIAVFPVNRMSGRTANHPRPASPLPPAIPSPSSPSSRFPIVVVPWYVLGSRSAANVNREFIPSGAASSGTERGGAEGRGEERKERRGAPGRKRKSIRRASCRVWVRGCIENSSAVVPSQRPGACNCEPPPVSPVTQLQRYQRQGRRGGTRE